MGAKSSRSKGLQAFTLAEGATHVAQSAKTSRAAFTLAEVLITLGIIGVVAAMTLPTLISNYQKKVYVNQLKKSVSMLSQGFTTMMGHSGAAGLSETDAFNFGSTYSCSHTMIQNDNCRSIREGLQSVFSGIQFTQCNGAKIKSLNGANIGTKITIGTCLKFPDGLEIFNYYFYRTKQGDVESSIGGFIGTLYIDVNGDKNPNTMGRDIFSLYLANNGIVYATGSQIVSEMLSGDSNSLYWRNAQNNEIFSCSTTFGYGEGCTAKVLEEDAINY